MKCNNVRIKHSGKTKFLFGTLELIDSNPYYLRLMQSPTFFESAKAVTSAAIEHPNETVVTIGQFALAAMGFRQRPSKSARNLNFYMNEKIEEATKVFWIFEIDKTTYVEYNKDAYLKLSRGFQEVEILFPSNRNAKSFYKKILAISQGKSPFFL